MPIWIKISVTAILVVLISEIAKRNEQVGAMITALPWVTFMAIIWLYLEKQTPDKLISYSGLTFWYVLATLPMFLVFNKMLSLNFSFWPAMTSGILTSIISLLLLAPLALKFGYKLL